MSEATCGALRPVYLVTILFNSADCIAAFGRDLVAQTFRNWRLIAIDNASVDDSAGALTCLADERIQVIRNRRNLGFARAANQGMRLAVEKGAEFLVLINNDTRMAPDLLARFIAARGRLGADVITPRIMYLDRPNEAWYAGGHLAYDWVFKNVHEQFDPTETRSEWTVDFASGCCLGLSAKVLKSVGLLDESLFVYWEDTDYCLRLKLAGVPIWYVHDLVLMHEGGHASGGERSVGFNRLFWRSYVVVIRKHFGLTVAMRSIARVALKELGRPEKRPRPLIAMLLALLRGMVTPIRPKVEI